MDKWKEKIKKFKNQNVCWTPTWDIPCTSALELVEPSTTVAEQIWSYKNGILSPAFKLSNTILIILLHIRFYLFEILQFDWLIAWL